MSTPKHHQPIMQAHRLNNPLEFIHLTDPLDAPEMLKHDRLANIDEFWAILPPLEEDEPNYAFISKTPGDAVASAADYCGYLLWAQAEARNQFHQLVHAQQPTVYTSIDFEEWLYTSGSEAYHPVILDRDSADFLRSGGYYARCADDERLVIGMNLRK